MVFSLLQNLRYLPEIPGRQGGNSLPFCAWFCKSELLIQPAVGRIVRHAAQDIANQRENLIAMSENNSNFACETIDGQY